MKKSLLSMVLVMGLAGTVALPQTSLALTESQRIQQELNQLKKEKNAFQLKANEAEKQMNQVAREKEQTTADIQTLLDQIDRTNLELKKLNEQIAQVSGNLAINANQLEQAEGRVQSRDQLLRSRIRLMYMNGAVSYADVLLSSTSFSDFLDRLEALRSIVSQDKEILEANERDRDTIATKRVEIENQLADVKHLYSQTSAIQADLLVKEKEKEVKIASLSQKEHELEEITEEAEAEMIRVATLEASKQQALQKAKAAEAAKKNGGKAPASPYTFSPGAKFSYPLPKVVSMSSDYGSRTDPVTGKKGAIHNGIDLPSPAGTSILAAADGVVIEASWVNGYGNTVIIDHGSGVWSLYGHIRNGGIKVEKGDAVKQGDKVAEVGSTGKSTGNHLHFEVRVNGSHTDPKPYLGMK